MAAPDARGSTTMAVSVSPIDSLRVAALQTLRNKKRSTFRPEASFTSDEANTTLSYDEAPSQPTLPLKPQASKSLPPLRAPTVKPTAASEREDGEISDPGDATINTTVTPSQPTPRSTSETNAAGSNNDAPTNYSNGPSADTNSKNSQESISQTPPGMEVDPSEHTSSRASSYPPPPTATNVVARIPSKAALDLLRSRLGMTPEEIFEAKITILDILGCGVHPQHLLDCGVSRTAVVVCLTELKLRIPEVLAGIIEDAEREVKAKLPAKQPKPQPLKATLDPPSPPIDSSSAVSPPPATPKPNPPMIPPSSLPSKPAFLPPKPTIYADRAPNVSVGQSTLLDPQTSNSLSQQSPTPKLVIDLDDIEQQRKRELLARRKVLQSLRAKEAAKAASALSSDIEPKTSSPKSLTTSSIEHAVPLGGSDDMQIDLLIADAIKRGEAKQVTHFISSTNTTNASNEDSPSGVDEAMEVEQALQSGEMEDSTSSPELFSKSTKSARRGQTSELIASRHLQQDAPVEGRQLDSLSSLPPTKRTSSKRPVAADFVDYVAASYPFEDDQLRSAADSSIIDSNGLPPHKRRKNFGPSSLSRVIIDLSEGESDSDEEPGDPPPNLRPKQLKETRRESSAPVSVKSLPPPRSMPPSKNKKTLWEEKQREIERMRELIRTMEEKKKKSMLTVAESRAASEPISPSADGESQTIIPPSSLPDPGMVVVKTEEGAFDLSVNNYGEAPRNTSAFTRVNNAYGANERRVNGSPSHTSAHASDNKPYTREQDATSTQDSSPLNPLIGVSDTANTEAFAGLQPHTEFRPYVSPFSLYPSLYSLASTHFSRPSSASSYSLSSAVINEVKRLDYGLLRQSHISSLSDPDLRCCRFEFSGDGTCSDPDCKDLHHRDVEPSDEEVANFAAPSFPEFPSEQLKNALMLTSSSAVMSSETSATSADPVQRRLMVAVRLLLVHKGIS